MEKLEYNNEKVLTTRQLAKFYETKENNIANNYNNNKDKFIEGKHYYLLVGEELKQFKNSFKSMDIVNKHSASLYLWTERGVLRHCKMLDTNKVWKQLDDLEEIYFKIKQHNYKIEDLIEKIKA